VLQQRAQANVPEFARPRSLGPSVVDEPLVAFSEVAASDENHGVKWRTLFKLPEEKQVSRLREMNVAA
jgi:hypothetical protein